MKISKTDCLRTPKADGFYMPGEFEPHEGTLMIWPWRPGSWNYGAKAARAAFAEIAEAIAAYEQVYLFVRPQDKASAQELLSSDRIHLIEAYFVVRAKKNLQCKFIKWKRRLPKNVLSDASVLLTGFYPKQYYPEPIRLVKYWDEEQEREFIFITNAMHISALQVAELYKNRWQVELFFKWLKQHLRIKRFWGTTENAVRIQIYAAICTYCLVAIIQHDMQLDRSTYEVLQILSISLTDKTHLKDLFDKTKFQNDKERFGPNGPSLFNF